MARALRGSCDVPCCELSIYSASLLEALDEKKKTVSSPFSGRPSPSYKGSPVGILFRELCLAEHVCVSITFVAQDRNVMTIPSQGLCIHTINKIAPTSRYDFGCFYPAVGVPCCRVRIEGHRLISSLVRTERLRCFVPTDPALEACSKFCSNTYHIFRRPRIHQAHPTSPTAPERVRGQNNTVTWWAPFPVAVAAYFCVNAAE